MADIHQRVMVGPNAEGLYVWPNEHKITPIITLQSTSKIIFLGQKLTKIFSKLYTNGRCT